MPTIISNFSDILLLSWFLWYHPLLVSQLYFCFLFNFIYVHDSNPGYLMLHFLMAQIFSSLSLSLSNQIHFLNYHLYVDAPIVPSFQFQLDLSSEPYIQLPTQHLFLNIKCILYTSYPSSSTLSCFKTLVLFNFQSIAPLFSRGLSQNPRSYSHFLPFFILSYFIDH